MAHGHEDFDSGTSIDAQEVAELAVDIAAQTVGNMTIDVAAQSIADQDVNIDAQTLKAVDQRPKFGDADSMDVREKVSAGTDATLAWFDGTGTLYEAVIRVEAATDSHLTKPYLYPDGNEVPPRRSYKWFSDHGWPSSGLTRNLVEYSVDGSCILVWTFPMGVSFENSMYVYAENPTGTDHWFDLQLSYALI